MSPELIDVCFKKINKQIENSWSELAKNHGIADGETLRCKFKKHRSKNGLLPKKETQISQELKNKLSELDLEKINLQKERIKLRDQKNELNKIIRETARRETLQDLIRESISELKPLVKNSGRFHINKLNDEMVIQISDSHFGLVIDNEFELYNEDVFITRFNNYIETIFQVKETHKTAICHVCFSGDCISGQIHPLIQRNNQYGIVEQTKKFSEYASKFLEILSNDFQTVNVHFVTGNHSRNFMAKDESENKDRYENFIIEFMKIRAEKLDNVKFHDSILSNTIATFDILGNFCCLTHGDNDSPQTVPSKLCDLLDKKPDLIFLGHRHKFEVLTIAKTKVITSGCWAVLDEYSVNKRLVGTPSQTITIVNGKGFVCAYDVTLK